MSLWDAFAPAEARDRERVTEDTWGHLAPEKNKKYEGRIVFAVGCLGIDDLNPTALVCKFDGLDSSPWFYDCLQEWLQNQKTEAGCTYEFKGHFRNYKFVGKVKKIADYNK